MKKILTAFSLIGMLFASCTKYNTDLKEMPSWNSDWLLPLVKGKVSFENLKELSNSKIYYDIPSLDIGYTNGIGINVPPLQIANVGPYRQGLSNWLHQVHFDSLEIKLTFTNSFPITVSAGTKFSFRRTADPNDPTNLIYQHTLPNDIAPQQSYSFDVKVVNNYLSDTIFQFLEQFTSPGANNVSFSNNSSRLQVEVKIIDIDHVEMFAGKSLQERDTVDIDFGSEDTGTDTSSYGKVNFFVDNAIPIHFGIQVYFLDPQSSLIIDSLLDNSFDIAGCNTNASGDPLNINSAKTSISITTKRIEKIKQARKAVIAYSINTLGYPPPYVLMSDQTYLKMQLTGDLHLSFNLNSL